MEILIKIDEKDYQSLKDGHIPFNMLDVIKNGTPLPKGHGRLIDADEFHHILEDMPMRNNDKWFNWLQKACNRLAEAPTIVEEDRSDEV